MLNEMHNSKSLTANNFCFEGAIGHPISFSVDQTYESSNENVTYQKSTQNHGFSCLNGFLDTLYCLLNIPLKFGCSFVAVGRLPGSREENALSCLHYQNPINQSQPVKEDEEKCTEEEYLYKHLMHTWENSGCRTASGQISLAVWQEGISKRPESFWQHPESFWQRPESFWQRPESFWQRPESFWQRPENF